MARHKLAAIAKLRVMNPWDMTVLCLKEGYGAGIGRLRECGR